MDNLKHRKAEARIRIVHPDQTPAENCPVMIDQISHKFLFGCGAFDTMAMINLPDGPDKQKFADRVEKWLGLFNYGTLPFYWGRYEPVPGQTAEKPTMEAAKYLQEKGVRTKGHPLCWHTVCAPWLMEYPNEAILRLQLERIQRDVTAFKGVIDMWDVINEVVIMPIFDKYDNAVTRICKEYGRIGLVKKVFAAAKESNPEATLLINDFNTSESYEILVDGLLNAGVPITAIGIQSHQHQGYWGLDKLHDVLERFSQFGVPIHFTENTLISGDLMPDHIVDLNDWQVETWPTTPEGEERQAKEIEEMYSVLFSHPLVEAITTWDFADGAWLHAPAGLIREDGSLKPSYEVLKKLIHGDWETHLKLTTDEEGYISFTGFKGNYQLTAGGSGFVLELNEDLDKEITLQGDSRILRWTYL